MTRLRILRAALGAGALVLIAAAATACGPVAAGAAPGTTVSGLRSTPATTSAATTTMTTTTTTTTATAPPSTTPAHSVGTGAPLPIVYTCDGQAVVRPSSLIVACADAGMALVGLHWTNWGGAVAHATGTLQEKQCIPSCGASGTIDTYRASATVSGLNHGHYTEIHITAPPAPGQPYDLPLPKSGS